MTTDLRGNPLTCDAASARRLDAAIAKFHTYQADPIAALDALIAEQPDCVMAHATRAALRMQAEPAAPLLALAVECGYSDHSSLSRQCLRLFGVRPGRIRGMLGWEWLMDRWLKRTERAERTEKTERDDR